MNTILFDLDGTLLPQDQDEFVRLYFTVLSTFMASNGVDGAAVVRETLCAIEKVVHNDGTKSNEAVFWDHFSKSFDEDTYKHLLPLVDRFYEDTFALVQEATSVSPFAASCIRVLKEKGYTLALATNPIFPRTATLARIRWAGLNPEDFRLITTYEEDMFCKPSPAYYAHVAQRLKVNPSQCLMVGNDTSDDMGAVAAGMNLYLITDCLINGSGVDVEKHLHGSFAEFYIFCQQLPTLNTL